MAKERTRSVRQGVLQILAIVFSIVATFYITRWLESDTTVKWSLSDNTVALVGTVNLTDKLQMNVETLTYDAAPFAALRVVQFLLVNSDSRNLRGGAQFVFTDGKGGGLRTDAIVDITARYLNESEVVPYSWKEIPGIGPGIELLGDLPGKSAMRLNLVIDVERYPGLAETDIVMKKVARGGDKLESEATSSRTITFTVGRFFLWIFLAAAIWGLMWLITNIVLGNYSTGARIANWAVKRAGFRGFIPER